MLSFSYALSADPAGRNAQSVAYAVRIWGSCSCDTTCHAVQRALHETLNVMSIHLAALVAYCVL